MKKRIALAVFLATCGDALAFSQEQFNALDHIGQVVAGEQLCSRAKINDAIVGLIMAGHGLDAKDSIVVEIVRKSMRETIDAWEGLDEDLACAALMVTYGPAGTNVPGLMTFD